MLVKRNDLYKKISELFSKFEEIEKEIGKYTKPEGCRVFRRDGFWEIHKPIERTSLGNVIEIRFIADSEVDKYVTDKNKVLELLDELEKIHDEVMEIAKQLGEEGVKMYKDFILHYYYPYKPT